MAGTRLFALIGDMGTTAQTVHSWLIDGKTKSMPWPEVVVLEESSGESVMVYRYRRDGTFCGDTWHEDLAAAKDQASFEYGDRLGEWLEVPPAVDDATSYALALLREDHRTK